ncbi:MAG: hypothetical protein Q9181_004442 [Wetmoreana brouardii]
MSKVFETPQLISSLNSYSEERHKLPRGTSSSADHNHQLRKSLLFLKVSAAADYFTTNTTLMQTAPLQLPSSLGTCPKLFGPSLTELPYCQTNQNTQYFNSRKTIEAMFCNNCNEEPCSSKQCAAQRRERAQQHRQLLETGIYRLPTEILVNILERVDLINFPAMMIAMFHLLRARGIIPNYPTAILKMILLRPEQGNSHSASLATMPRELLLTIGHTLGVHEKVHMVIAAHRMSDEEMEMITHERENA